MFLETFEEYCRLALGDKVYSNNRFAIRTLGCSILNTATMSFVYRARSLPGNMFLAFVGNPRAGKSSIAMCGKVAIMGTHVSMIDPSTPEALVEEVEARRLGYLFWDEFGEVVKKARDYMGTLSEKMNRMYYRDDVSMKRASKPSISLPMRSYYLSAAVTCVPEQWKEAETLFYGGFERRWLTLNVRGKIPLFEDLEFNPEAAEQLAKIHRYLAAFKGWSIVVKNLNLAKYAKHVEKRVDDELKQGTVEEYVMKVLAAEVINSYFEDIIKIVSSQVSHVSHNPVTSQRSFVMVCDDICDTMGPLVICDKNKNSGGCVKYITIDACDVCDELIVKYDIIDNIIYHVTGLEGPAEKEMAELVDKVSRSTKKFMLLSEFVREVLKTRNANWYRPRIVALEEGGYIRVVEHSGRKIVILDPNAKICGNCAKWDGLPCDASKIPLEMQAERELYSPVDECRYPERFERR
jgi:hypothetical protein